MAQEKENFLGRWSRVKLEQEQRSQEAASVPQKTEAQEKPPDLPPLDTLTPASEFAGFMHPKVEDALRRAALKKLFADPHFNIPDPYEAYSGDWTVGEPIPDEMMATLNQARLHLFSDKQREEADAKDAAGAQAKAAEEQAKVAEEQAKVAEQPTPKDDEPGRQDT
jgi:hypothetical protein